MVRSRRIIRILEKRLPSSYNRRELLEWLVISLGISTNRDLDNTALKIMDLLLERAKYSTPVRIDDLVEEIKISKSTAHHHLEKMLCAGILEKTKEGYYLKGRNLEQTIEEVELEVHRMLERIKKIAKEIDRQIF